MQIYRQKADLTLREFIDADFPSLVSLRTDRETQFNLMTAQSLVDWDVEANSWAHSMVVGDYKGLRGAFDTSQTLTSGFIGYWQLLPQNDLTFLGLAILPSQRGQGYGRAGFALLKDLATDLELLPLCLEVLESNSHAIRIYLECGFNVVSSESKIVYGESCNVFTMTLQ